MVCDIYDEGGHLAHFHHVVHDLKEMCLTDTYYYDLNWKIEVIDDRFNKLHYAGKSYMVINIVIVIIIFGIFLASIIGKMRIRK